MRTEEEREGKERHLENQAALWTWATPTTRDHKGGFLKKTKQGRDLSTDVEQWATLRAQERSDYQRDQRTKGKERFVLTGQAKNFPCSLQVQEMKDGVPSSPDSLGLLLRYRRWLYSALGCPWREMPTPAEELKANSVQLNPYFAEWLMNWSIAWTDFGSVEMESYLCRLRLRLRFCITE